MINAKLESCDVTDVHSPFYDGRTVFSLDVTQLKPGDIILTRNRLENSKVGRAQSSLIAAVGKSNFSHALICAQPPTVIEAIGPGVSTLSIARTFYHAERDVVVLRYHDPVIARRASARAGLFLGKGYSVRMAVQSVLPAAAAADQPMEKTFCSALVVACYRATGAAEFQSINPYRTTPGDLTRMEFLKNVTALVMRPMLAPQNIEHMTALDGERKPSPFDGQAKALYVLHASVAGDIDAFIRQWDLVLEIPTTFFEALDFLVHALQRATNGDDHLKETQLWALRAIDQKLADAFDQSDLHKMNADADALEAATLADDLRESFGPDPDIDIGAARAMLEATAGQIKSRNWVLEDEHRAEGVSLAWDRWCEMSARTILALKNRQTILREVLGRVDPGFRETK